MVNFVSVHSTKRKSFPKSLSLGSNEVAHEDQLFQDLHLKNSRVSSGPVSLTDNKHRSLSSFRVTVSVLDS